VVIRLILGVTASCIETITNVCPNAMPQLGVRIYLTTYVPLRITQILSCIIRLRSIYSIFRVWQRNRERSEKCLTLIRNTRTPSELLRDSVGTSLRLGVDTPDTR
jgi:hypothetical protein